MPLFSFFERKWSAKTMTDLDRRKIYWYLKRKTSYTAWKREADIFDRFAEVFAKQIGEQPHAPGRMDGTDWPLFRSKVVKAQRCYEQALARLLTGDRTIFLNNDGGVMVDAATSAEYWYTELVDNGARGDHSYDGKYVPALTALMHAYSDACAVRGYLQPMTSETPAPEWWTTFWYDAYVRLGIPDDVPKVPPPGDIIVMTGETVPAFGVYEPQIKDGCMNYLLAGTRAPTVWESDGAEATGRVRFVRWRLIWEDRRYVDGTLPLEEASYFPARVTPLDISLAPGLATIPSAR